VTRDEPAVPELWWSPSRGLYRQTRYAGLNRILTSEHRQVIGGVPHDALPNDAARLVLDDPETRRPVVLLRAEDCACRCGDDCPHGPEPVDALDLAVWLHAEARWQLDLEEDHTRDVASRRSDLATERDALQARLDAANLIVSRAIDDGLPADEALRLLDRVLTGKTARALQGDQPTEPRATS
jgi:hypothetical protein